MGVIEILVIIGAALVVALVIGVAVWRRATGRKSDCGCGCDCSHCAGCRSSEKKKNDRV